MVDPTADPQPQPTTIAEVLQRALERHAAGDLLTAERLYRHVLDAVPDQPGALHNLGVLALQTGHPREAVVLLRRAVEGAPGPDAYSNLGLALNAANEKSAAIEALRQAARLAPDFAPARLNLGLRLYEAGKFEEATDVLLRACRLDPANLEAHVALATALWQREMIKDAINVSRRAIALNPNEAAAHNILGLSLAKLKEYDQALVAFHEAVRCKADLREAWVNLAKLNWEIGDIQASMAAVRRATELGAPDDTLDGWRVFYLNYDPDVTPKQSFHEHLNWAAEHAEPLLKTIAPHENDPDPDRRIRIGYISPDFRRQSVAFFLEPVLEHAPRDEVSIHLYSDVEKSDDVTERLRTIADSFEDVKELEDEQLAQRIREDKIDVLVDLTGHTGNNRILVHARQPAPVQVSYLGYANTTALKTVRYRLTDAIADPPGMTEHLHTETLVRLPSTAWCYRPPDGAPPVEPPPVEKSGHVTFGCFNILAKINDPLLRLWSEVLDRVPDARLMLKAVHLTHAAGRRAITDTLRRCRVDPDRVILVGRDDHPGDHLKRYAHVDIMLDPYPYNGTTTTCEALWMGVPVVSLAGKSHISRVGASLLTTVGLPELVASSPAQYVDLAGALAQDPQRLHELRATMRDRMRSSPLMDEARFARDYHDALRGMWKSWCTDRMNT